MPVTRSGTFIHHGNQPKPKQSKPNQPKPAQPKPNHPKPKPPKPNQPKPKRPRHRPTSVAALGDSDGDAYEEEEENQEFEDLEPRVQHHRRNNHRGHADHGAGYQPLDELTKRMKVDMPDFFGKLKPNAFEDWLTIIKDYFDWFVVSEDRKMMFKEMLQLKQRSLSVDKFTDHFHELTVRSKIMETEQQTLAQYRTGLCSELREEMWTAHLINVDEAYQLALHIEKQMGL
uniref:Retrotransposon gag domain-containing protein n=1 Tax=Populus alba TaxID=43335 RepID=A0A4U5QL22_POPAL|nr:hypothetical protein D5086_0000073460 [Populus alba]